MVAIVLGALILLLIAYVIWNHNSGFDLGNLAHQEEEKEVTPEWVPVAWTDDADKAIKITWTEKYGPTTCEYCRALFESDTQYKLVSPVSSLIIEKSNNCQYKIEETQRPDSWSTSKG